MRIEPPASVPICNGPNPAAPAAPGARRRAAGGELRVPRVARDAVQRAVAGRLPAELGGGGLADDHRAGGFQADHARRVLDGRRRVGGAAAAARREAGKVDQVLHRAGHAVEQAERAAGGPARRAVAGRVQRARIEHGEGVEAGVEPGDPFGDGLQHLDRAERPAGVERQHLLGGQQRGIGARHAAHSCQGRVGQHGRSGRVRKPAAEALHLQHGRWRPR